jgi:tetrathionate reductase subunit C
MGWMFRWVVLMDVQTVARNSAGFHHYGIPAGSSGILGIVGTFGLWLAAVLVIDLLIPWRQARQGGSAADVSLSASDSNAQPDAKSAEGALRHG